MRLLLTVNACLILFGCGHSGGFRSEDGHAARESRLMADHAKALCIIGELNVGDVGMPHRLLMFVADGLNPECRVDAALSSAFDAWDVPPELLARSAQADPRDVLGESAANLFSRVYILDPKDLPLVPSGYRPMHVGGSGQMVLRLVGQTEGTAGMVFSTEVGGPMLHYGGGFFIRSIHEVLDLPPVDGRRPQFIRGEGWPAKPDGLGYERVLEAYPHSSFP